MTVPSTPSLPSELAPKGASEAVAPQVGAAAEALPEAAYAVKLPAFEGPLDLLLHLIRLNEVEVTEIPIARICEQYLEYLELMRELSLDVAGEYLLMAATLAWIKSRMLLPPDDDEEAEEGPDPREDLIRRLLEYQRFKEAAEGLEQRRWLGRDVFRAHPASPEPLPEGEREIEAGLFDLVEAFRRVLAGAGPERRVHEVEVESVTVRDRMLAVMRSIEGRGSLDFEMAVRAEVEGAPSRAVIVTTFLAVLELSRLAVLCVFQSVNEVGCPKGPIHLRTVADAASDWTERIADLM